MCSDTLFIKYCIQGCLKPIQFILIKTILIGYIGNEPWNFLNDAYFPTLSLNKSGSPYLLYYLAYPKLVLSLNQNLNYFIYSFVEIYTTTKFDRCEAKFTERQIVKSFFFLFLPKADF
jgi:hypothetical protein